MFLHLAQLVLAVVHAELRKLLATSTGVFREQLSACSLNSPPSAPPSAVPSGPATAVPIPMPTSFSAYFRQFVGPADMAFILTNSAVLVRHSDDICLIPRGQLNAAGAAIRKSRNRPSKVESQYTLGLAPGVANQVARYAQTVDTSMSKAIAALVRIGLESQEESGISLRG